MIAFLLLSCAATSQEVPVIVTRDQWGAKEVGPGAKEHQIVRITIHHTGVKSNANRSLEEKLRGLQAFSQRKDKLSNGKDKPAWPDVPYHYYISIDGRIGEGRPWNLVGDTNTEYDPTGHLLIVVEGEFGIEDPTAKQMDSLREMLDWATEKFHVAPDLVQSHRDYAKTDCPGQSLTRQMPRLRNYLKGNLILKARRSGL